LLCRRGHVHLPFCASLAAMYQAQQALLLLLPLPLLLLLV
jgi:hypothetical protein